MPDLKNLHPVLQEKANQFIALCKAKGIDVAITQGFRTIAYQNSLYAQGRTTVGKIVTNCKGGQSPHNYGLAFDFVILTNGRADWDSRNKNWGIAGSIGESLGLTWGGEWTKFVDLPHLEFLFGLSIQDLIKGKKAPNVVKVKSPVWLKELREEYLVRVGKDIYSTLDKVADAKELASLTEKQLVRIGKSIYKKLN